MKNKKTRTNFLFPDNRKNDSLLKQPGDYFHVDITKSGKTICKVKQGKSKQSAIYYPTTGTLVTIQSRTFEPYIEDYIYDKSDYHDEDNIIWEEESDE